MDEYPIGYETIGYVALVAPTVGVPASTKQVYQRAMDRFALLGVDVELHTASSVDGVQSTVRAAMDDDVDAVVVCGGDRHINAAVQLMAGSDIPLGVLPVGGRSDVARQFRMPSSPEAAAEVIYEGFTTTSDVGVITDTAGRTQYFTSVACAGLVTRSGQGSSRWGSLRTAVGQGASLLRAFAAMTPRRYRVEFQGLADVPHVDEGARAVRDARDGQAVRLEEHSLVLERRMNLVPFGNTRLYAGGMALCPRADHHDGLLDVTVIEDVNRVSVLRSVRSFQRGDHVDFEYCSSYRCQSATITPLEDAPGDQPVIYTDGGCSLPLPVTVSSQAAAVRFIVPAP